MSKTKEATIESTTRQLKGIKKALGVVGCGFVWRDTSQGQAYWNRVHDELIAEEKALNAKLKKLAEPSVRHSHYFLDGESSLIRAIGWQDDILHVVFHNGSSYQYQEVPEAVYVEMAKSTSPGAYFNRHIKGVFVQRYTAA